MKSKASVTKANVPCSMRSLEPTGGLGGFAKRVRRKTSTKNENTVHQEDVDMRRKALLSMGKTALVDLILAYEGGHGLLHLQKPKNCKSLFAQDQSTRAKRALTAKEVRLSSSNLAQVCSVKALHSVYESQSGFIQPRPDSSNDLSDIYLHFKSSVSKTAAIN